MTIKFEISRRYASRVLKKGLHKIEFFMDVPQGASENQIVFNPWRDSDGQVVLGKNKFLIFSE